MSIVIRKKEDTSVTYEQIVDLIHDSFKERLEQGLRFSCSFISVEEYINRTENSIILVAILIESKALVGTVCITISQDKNNHNYGYLEYVAISPSLKRSGIGKELEENATRIAIENGCMYIVSDTSVGAKSSVLWHKKNGYKIVGLRSFGSTNYYSYLFRKQLIGISIREKIAISINCCYSFTKTLLTLKKNGRLRRWVWIFKKWKNYL